MEDAEPTIPAPVPAPVPATEPDAAAVTPARTVRAQRLATALRENLRRRKAAARSTPTVKPSN